MACGSSLSRVAFRKNGYAIARCLDCGHGWVSPFPGREELAALYNEEFFEIAYFQDQDVRRKNFELWVRAIGMPPAGGRLVDVGCADGLFLEISAKEWDVRGIEISRFAAESIRARLGIPVDVGELPDLSYPDGSFDVVTMWDVLEHVPNPDAYVRSAFRVLRPGGRVYITTGDFDSGMARVLGRKWRLISPPFHLHFFSRRSMRRMLESAGFEVRTVETSGRYVTLRHLMFIGHSMTQLGLCRVLYERLRDSRIGKARLYVDVGDIMLVGASRPEVPPGSAR
ncbi:MAG: class I SAM-dependent methyltransferase [Candidatus Rokubacteria bacterium]|nr:class I SAM-dependent methyltransferase [Candidatus Rokubacteria bacterium]